MIAEKTKTQEEFFNIFNFLFNTNKQIILTCDQSPKYIKGIEERLKTRLNQGLTTRINPPELEMRIAILEKKSKKANIKLPEHIASFIAQHVRNNIRDLEGAINNLKAKLHFNFKNKNKEIDENFVKEALQ